MRTRFQEHRASIKVVGVGGGGGNALSRMSEALRMRSVEFIAINTDAQDLDYCSARRKLYIGKNVTRGLGAGMNPELGRQAAEENRTEIVDALRGADLVFITAGLGGGTGSGASSVVADAAHEVGALTIAVVTKPFGFEGVERQKIADAALLRLRDKVDTMIVVPNDKIFSVIQKETSIIKAFAYIDDVLRYAVQGIAELITMPGIINVDFADIKSIMEHAGSALVGIGIAHGAHRAETAIKAAVSSPLLEISIDGAKGVLFVVSGGKDLKMSEIADIAKVIHQSVDPNAKIIFGAYHDRRLSQGHLKVIVVATGFNGSLVRSQESAPPDLFSVHMPRVPERTSAAGEGVYDALAKEKTAAKNGPPSRAQTKSKEELWEIPAFLRKRRKQ